MNSFPKSMELASREESPSPKTGAAKSRFKK